MYIELIAKLFILGNLSLDDATKYALPLPNGQAHRPVGITAIAVNEKEAIPFVKDDVVVYFKTHNLPRNLNSKDQIQVDSLQFLTSAEVSVRLQGESTGLDDKELLGFAELSGQFTFGGPNGKTATFPHAYAAFDATTGNLLMVGTLP